MHYSAAFLALFVSVFVVPGLSPEPEPPLVLDIAVTDVYDASATPLAFIGCDVDCYTPHTCGSCGHKAPFVGWDAGSHHRWDGSHTSCWEGQCHEFNSVCWFKHPECRRTEEQDAALAAIDNGDFAELYALTDMGARIETHWDTGLLVFNDCANRVVASIALTATELAALAVADGQLQ